MKDLLLDGLRNVGPKARDRIVRDQLERPVMGSLDAVIMHLDFNARMVTALREEKLWPRLISPPPSTKSGL